MGVWVVIFLGRPIDYWLKIPQSSDVHCCGKMPERSKAKNFCGMNSMILWHTLCSMPLLLPGHFCIRNRTNGQWPQPWCIVRIVDECGNG